jgi:hypothetical protein
MDFVDGLPKSHGKSTILVVVDQLTNYSYFIPISHPYTTPKSKGFVLKTSLNCRNPLCVIGIQPLEAIFGLNCFLSIELNLI